MAILDLIGIFGLLAALSLMLAVMIVIATMGVMNGLDWLSERKQRNAASRAQAPAAKAQRQAQATTDRAAAQEIADREGYPVHVRCDGEVWYGTCCHGCDQIVLDDEVVKPTLTTCCAAPRVYQGPGMTGCSTCGVVTVNSKVR